MYTVIGRSENIRDPVQAARCYKCIYNVISPNWIAMYSLYAPEGLILVDDDGNLFITERRTFRGVENIRVIESQPAPAPEPTPREIREFISQLAKER